MKKQTSKAKEAIYKIIENQIKDNEPQEVKITLNRLISEGKSEEEAINLIGCALSAEMFEVLKHNTPYNKSRYVSYLNNLPEMPWEEWVFS